MLCSKQYACVGSLWTKVYTFHTSNGSHIWSKAFPEMYVPFVRAIGAHNGIVLAQGYRFNYRHVLLQAFQAPNGSALWQREDDVTTLPIVSLKAVFIPKKGGIAAISFENGQPIWATDIDGQVDSCVTNGADVFVGNKIGKETLITKLNGDDGRIIWQVHLPKNTQVQSAIDDSLITMAEEKLLTSISATTGSKVWEASVKEQAVIVLASQKKAYTTRGSRSLVAINGMTGQQIWRFDSRNTVRSLLVEDERAFVSWDKHGIVCIEGGTGVERWQHNFSSPISPIINRIGSAGQNILVGTDDRFLWCLDKSSGSIQWQTPMSDAIHALSLIDEVVFCSAGSSLYALDAKSGLCHWSTRGDNTGMSLAGEIILA